MADIEVLLDASAVLAWLQDEPGARVVDNALSGAALCAVTAAEVVHKLLRAGQMTPADAHQVVQSLNLPIVSFTEAMFARCGSLSQEPGLSLGDRLCLAAGQEMAIPILTADQRWANLPYDIRMIRPAAQTGRG